MRMTTYPKCQSPNVFVSENGVGWDLYLQVLTGDDMVSIGDWETYLCTDCGYFENYVTDNDWLKKVKAGRAGEYWHKVE